MFYIKTSSVYDLPYKGYAAFFVSNKIKFLQILRDLDADEFDNYACNDKGEFLIPIYEIQPNDDGVFAIENLHKYSVGYVGKFDIDGKKLSEACACSNIEFFLHVEDVHPACQ